VQDPWLRTRPVVLSRLREALAIPLGMSGDATPLSFVRSVLADCEDGRDVDAGRVETAFALADAACRRALRAR
jgi:hypothetical protein